MYQKGPVLPHSFVAAFARHGRQAKTAQQTLPFDKGSQRGLHGLAKAHVDGITGNGNTNRTSA